MYTCQHLTKQRNHNHLKFLENVLHKKLYLQILPLEKEKSLFQMEAMGGCGRPHRSEWPAKINKINIELYLFFYININ